MKKQRVDIKKVIKKRIENDIKNRKEKSLNHRIMDEFSIIKPIPVALSLSKNKMRAMERTVGSVIINKEEKKINVIISAYRAVDFIEECLNSIENQTVKCNKILLGIDGCEDTLNKVVEIGDRYSNLEVYFSVKNKGPYQMFNALINLVPDDEYFQIFGADDVMNLNMLEEMSKFDKPIVSRNDGVLFIKKDVFNKIGGFRGWRCAADSDMLFRLGKVLNTKILRAPQYFFRRVHDGQLTKASKTNHRSKLRKQYVKIFEENKNSPTPDIFIEPICSKIIKIVINRKESENV